MPKDSKNPTPSPDTPEAFLPAPKPVSKRYLSPLEFFAMTHERRADLDGAGDGFGLIQEPVGTIDKKGVRLLNRYFWHPLLQGYTTGDKRYPQRNMHLRYDRARAAREILEEIQLFEEDEQGARRFVVTCTDDSVSLPGMSAEEAMAARAAFMRAQAAMRTEEEKAYMTIQGGGQLVEELLRETAARRKRQSRTRHHPSPVGPIRPSDERESDPGSRYGQELAAADSEELGGGPAAAEGSQTVQRPRRSEPDQMSTDAQEEAKGAALGELYMQVEAEESDDAED